METYEADLAKVVAEQHELVNAEKLLDLPVIVYPEVISIQENMKSLRQIYDLYKAQQVGYRVRQSELHTWTLGFSNILFVFLYICQEAKSQWSQTLWVDLNIHLLQEGIEGFIKKLRKLPKDVRALPVASFLEVRMKEFRDSLPLLLDLKNEALRDRSVCGVTEDPDCSKSLIEAIARCLSIIV